MANSFVDGMSKRKTHMDFIDLFIPNDLSGIKVLLEMFSLGLSNEIEQMAATAPTNYEFESALGAA